MPGLPAAISMPQCVSGNLLHRRIGTAKTATKTPSRNSIVKKLVCMLIVAIVTPLLSGCFGKGSSAPPPSNFNATAGDGRVVLTWTPSLGVDYWLFTATDPSLTAFNWTGLPNAHAYINATTPYYMCGLFNGTQYYFAANGRTNSGSGGPSSPTITTTLPPYNASAAAWTAVSPASGVPSTTNLYGVGYTSLTTCGNIATISATGSFAAVGAGGAIFTSPDGISWTSQTPSGFTSDLYAVTGYAANQNNPTNPALRWIAVGDGGASIYSTDGINWINGRAYTASNPALRSITHVAGTYTAVGDLGTILSTTDGTTWTTHSSGLTTSPLPNLNGVTHGGIYVAVGDGGTILTNSDGNTWVVKTPTLPISSNLRQVTSFISSYGSIYVAVGDAGTVVTSKDGGATWVTQTAITGNNLVSVAAESQYVANPAADTSLGFISTAQFVAVDSSGNAYTSVNGYTWSNPIPTNATGLNALVSSGFGYVAAGNAGATAYAF